MSWSELKRQMDRERIRSASIAWAEFDAGDRPGTPGVGRPGSGAADLDISEAGMQDILAKLNAALNPAHPEVDG